MRRILAGTTAVNGEAKYRHCWLVRFASREIIDSYNNQADQIKFAKSASQQNALDKTSLNYEISE
ncbi:MAG: hypothetical protein ACYC2E_08295 [Sulfuricella sp.]